MRVGFLALTTLALAIPCLRAENAEMRGTWINPSALTAARREQTFRHARFAGFNTLFLRAPSLKNKHGLNHGLGSTEDFRAAVAMAPAVAALMAAELERDAAWEAAQVSAFEKIARGYLPA